MQITDESLAVYEEFFRLLGRAINTPGLPCEIDLARFVVAQKERFISIVESLPGTAGQHIKLYEYEDKYINGTQRQTP